MNALTAKTACRAPFEGVPFLLSDFLRFRIAPQLCAVTRELVCAENTAVTQASSFAKAAEDKSKQASKQASKPLFSIKACFYTSEIFLSARKTVPVLFFYRRKSGVPDEFCLSSLSDR